MKKYINFSFFKLSLGLIVFVAFSSLSYAQGFPSSNLSGPSPVTQGDTETYIYNAGIAISTHSWGITGGTLISNSSSGTAYSAVVQWNNTGTGGVSFKGKHGAILETLIVTVEQGAAPPTVVTELNYVHNITPRIATTNITTLGNTNKIEAINYFDGLGRPTQQVAIRAGGDSEDIITHIAYDEFGRSVKEYLPYSSTTNSGTYRLDALAATNTFYDASAYDDDFSGMTTADINPYSEKEFDNSPLNRVMQQAAPGKDWKLGNGHEIEMEYLTNTFDPNNTNNSNNDNVKLYTVSLSLANNTYTPTLNLSSGVAGYYDANELHKTVTKDENHDGTSTKNHTTEEFKNKQGQVILKRTYDNSVPHDTYYVYDDYGNLSYVLPPKAEPQSAKPDATELSELCYQYKYDHLNRLVEKKIPGKGWESIVYNILDQPILTQDANLDSQNKWLFTKYDVFGRVAYTGYITSGSSRITLQNAANAVTNTHVSKLNSSTTIAGTVIYYNNIGYPTANITKIYTINYYDDYDFDLVSGFSEPSYSVWPITNPKGLATGSKVRVLDTNDWITSVSYYDDKARPIYVYSYNAYLDTTDKVFSQLTFDGRTTETTTSHSRTGYGIQTIYDKYDYDHTNRVKSHNQKINNAALYEVISSNTYDDLGQLVSKGVGGKENAVSRLQTVDYKYNIRGWLKKINDPSSLGNDLFGFKLNYNTKDHNGIKLYNGNIAETEWKTQNDNVLRWYNYQYDALNRIINADSKSGNYDLNSVAYDKNGNITSLSREGHINGQATSFDTMDDLVYTYETKSNRLKKVDDTENFTYGFKDGAALSIEYTYDSNGNMLSDANKDITSINYNHLNLPTQVNLVSGNIQYIYDATGVKLKKIVSTGTNTEYAGNFIYENGPLQFFSHTEGYTEQLTSGKKPTYRYVYQYKDQTGNVRLSYSDSNNDGQVAVNEIIEENNYYPFGLTHKGYNNIVSANSNSSAKKFTYNGVEHEEALGLNMSEMFFRLHDPAIARWNSTDVVTHFSVSPYSVMDNNPVFWADPTGADSWKYDWDSNDGTYVSNSTGERSKDWEGAIFETQAELDGYVSLPAVEINYIKGNDTYNNTQNRVAAFGITMSIRNSNFYSFENQNVDEGGMLITGSKVQGSSNGFFGKLFHNGSLEYGNTVYGVNYDGRVTGLAPLGGSGSMSLLAGPSGASNLWKVGQYNNLRKLKSGYDAHHVGQKALMQRFIPGYNKQTAPSILVPREGHTLVGATGRVTTSMEGVANARQLIARDILELRRVYPSIPNSSLKQLIKMNKQMYPNAFRK